MTNPTSNEYLLQAIETALEAMRDCQRNAHGGKVCFDGDEWHERWATLSEARRRLKGTHETTPDEDEWVIVYADRDRLDEHFSGTGATAAARARFDQLKMAWTCRLFRCVDKTGYGPTQETTACRCPGPLRAPFCPVHGDQALPVRQLGPNAAPVLGAEASGDRQASQKASVYPSYCKFCGGVTPCGCPAGSVVNGKANEVQK